MQKAKRNSYRYERKFIVPGLSMQALELIIKLHPAIFSEIFHRRFVNNIYFDSVDFVNFRDNIEGSTRRMKLRIRWYGDLFGQIKRPVLEIKCKNGFLGTKESYKLKSFELKKGIGAKHIGNIFDSSEIPEILKSKVKTYMPVLLNRYSRKYYQSADKKYRLTVDNGMLFHQVRSRNNFFLYKTKDDQSLILELKYAENKDDDAHQISSKFPFRITKSSKYVAGINALYLLNS